MAPTALQVLLAALLLLSSARDVGGVVLRPDGTPDLTACSCVPTAQCILHPFLPTSDIDFQCERPGHVCCVPDSIVIGAQVCTCRTSRCTGSIAGKCPTPGEFCCSGSISPNPNQPPTPALEAGDEALHPAVESPSAATKGTTMETVPSASYSQVTLAPQQPHRQVTLDMSVPLAPTTDQQHASDPKPLQLRPEDRQEQQPANTIDPAQIPVEETTKFLDLSQAAALDCPQLHLSPLSKFKYSTPLQVCAPTLRRRPVPAWPENSPQRRPDAQDRRWCEYDRRRRKRLNAPRSIATFWSLGVV
ncbi:hypothetical protein C7M84_022463 [Penaeus vannamei]|uniref:Uncharacterized protein n=1 Tax=Penaeus vannamei TaxID=6689 RepID=A0A3R7MKU0_PENVA|nr:hypothetical protein C7M84_022463 [Penaeus vannamei]